MLLKRITLENFRSFLERTEFTLDGEISILIGPNGGGKTNLLDLVITVLQRFLFKPQRPNTRLVPGAPLYVQGNGNLGQLTLERHVLGANLPQFIEMEVEVTETDLENMLKMKETAAALKTQSDESYAQLSLGVTNQWDVTALPAGTRFAFHVVSEDEVAATTGPQEQFLQYLRLFEVDRLLRERYQLAPLSSPVLCLPAIRAAGGLALSTDLSSYDDVALQKMVDSTFSRSNTQLIPLAVGRLSQQYLNLIRQYGEEKAAIALKEEPNVRQMTRLLGDFGYSWSLRTLDPNRNSYSLELSRGRSHLDVGLLSSGERELLIYLLGICLLDLKNALIVIDEPELHLHPQWQRAVLGLFVRLSKETGNQFLMATHSPTFISPESIQYVSRVFRDNETSRVTRLSSQHLPNLKKLFNVITSQNNERIFFADKVVLVEGLLDRIFFEALLDRAGRNDLASVIEVIDVGGKGQFDTYSKVLRACAVDYCIIADRDYLNEKGGQDVRGLFKVDCKGIKKDVLENIGSMDGEVLVRAIDRAMDSQSWSDAKDIWAYIKSRRVQFSDDLTPGDTLKIDAEVKRLASTFVYVLRRGALEDYLPEGHGAKDVAKLIDFVAEKNFFERIPEKVRPELKQIVEAILVSSKIGLTSS